MKPSPAGAVAYSLAFVVILSFFFHVHFIESSADESLLWNAKEVFLFVQGEHRGYSPSYAGYLAAVAKPYFGVVDSPDDRRPYTVIIRVTPSGVERYEESEQFDFFTPRGDPLYAWHDGDLWLWKGSHFEELSSEQAQQFRDRPSLPKR